MSNNQSQSNEQSRSNDQSQSNESQPNEQSQSNEPLPNDQSQSNEPLPNDQSQSNEPLPNDQSQSQSYISDEYIINIIPDYHYENINNDSNYYNISINQENGGNQGNGADEGNINSSIQNEIRNKVSEIFEQAFTIMFDGIPESYTNLLEATLFENMRYDDDDVSTILTHTIRTFISITSISFVRVIAVILNYASRETEGIYSNNLLFANNYDMVYYICTEELRKQITRSYRMIQFVSLFFGMNGEQEMENVKLVMKKEDILGMFPEKEYNTFEQDIKSKNEKCVFCQENFNDDDKCRKLNCEHVFHVGCIDEWLENQSYKCPCCRADAGPHYPKE
jgi:hypothetical protein